MKRWLIGILLPVALTASAQSLSLKDCLEYGAQQNASVKNSSLDILSARAQKTEARLEYLPKVSITGFSYYALHPLVEITLKDVLGNSDAANDLNTNLSALARENGIKPSYSTLKWGYGVAATLMQPVYAGGRIRAGNRLADLGEEAALLKDSILRRSVLDSVETKYWRIVALQQKRQTLRETSDFLESLTKNVASARSAGLATEPQTLELALKKNELAAGIRRLEGGISLLKMDLLDWIAYPYRYLDLASITLSDSLGTLPPPREVLLEDPDLSTINEQRLLSIQVEAKQQEKKMAVGELLPQIAVGGGYGYSALMGPKDGSFNGLVFATVQIPLTDIPKAVFRARRYEYAVQKAVTDRDYLTSRLRLQERMFYQEVETAWDELCIAGESVALAEDALSRIRIRYEAGEVTLAELLQTQLSVTSAREQLTDRQIAYRLAVNAYRSRVGITTER
ncbi:MAG: TolC family protein [Bacteroidales bacterium]|nr:TolC family protein [Bacteroidales bacterium]